MTNPTKSTSKRAILLDWISTHWVISSILSEIFIFGIPLLILRIGLADADIKAEIKSLSDSISTDTDVYFIVIGIVIVWRITASIGVKIFKIMNDANVLLDAKKTFILIHQLEEPVNGKALRFANALEKMQKSSSRSVGATLESITDPEAQIFLINKAIFELFSSLFPDIPKNKIKTRIALMQDNQPVRWQAYQPVREGVPKTDIAQLQGESTIAIAARSKTIVIVEDIKKSTNKKVGNFLATPSKTITKGSLICYPVLRSCTDDVPLVISIYIPKANAFSLNDTDSYEWLLARFASRLEVESCLFDIKRCA